MQMQIQRRDVGENTESERRKYIELDRIWGKKVLLICGGVGLFVVMIMMMPVNYDPIYAPIYTILARIYEYMVMCKIVSFVTTIISMAMFTIIVILIVLLSSILFLAFVFAFTNV
jgi:hypothetical protein